MIFVIALVVFGPQKLPDLGRSAGKMIAEFRKVSRELSEDVTRAALDAPESRPAAQRHAASPPPAPAPLPAAAPAPAQPPEAPAAQPDPPAAEAEPKPVPEAAPLDQRETH